MNASSQAVVFLNQAPPAGVELAAADSGQVPPRTTTRPPRAMSRKIWMRLARMTKTSRGCSWPCSQLVVLPETEGVGMSVHAVTRNWMDLSAAAAKELAMLATTSPATPLPTADTTGQRPSVRYVTTTLQPAGIPP